MVRVWMRQLTVWDTKVFHLFFGKVDRKSIRRFFLLVSRSADPLSRAIWGLAGGIWLPGAAPFLAAGLAAFGLELSLYYLLKKGIRRPRPFQTLAGVRFLIAPPDEFSFPSGHTAAAFLMATLVTAACPWLAGPAFLWAGMVGFSRVYLGVHYPTDVLAGMALGFFSAQAGWVAVHSWM